MLLTSCFFKVFIALSSFSSYSNQLNSFDANPATQLCYQKMDTLPKNKSAININDTTAHHIDIEATVDPEKWRNHLEKKFSKVVDRAIKQGMPPGTYSVSVRFLVEKDGRIKFAEAITDPGYRTGDGLIDVIKSAPKWKPGYRDGIPLRSYHTQPMTFIVDKKQ